MIEVIVPLDRDLFNEYKGVHVERRAWVDAIRNQLTRLVTPKRFCDAMGSAGLEPMRECEADLAHLVPLMSEYYVRHYTHESEVEQLKVIAREHANLMRKLARFGICEVRDEVAS